MNRRCDVFMRMDYTFVDIFVHVNFYLIAARGRGMLGARTGRGRGGMKTILAIDDEPAVLRVVRSILEAHGYRVKTTTKPVDAAALLAKTPFDLLILDFMMPQKTGLEVFEEIKRTGRPLPILFLTGYARVFEMDTEEKLRFWREQFTDGLTDVLYKPFDNSVLVEKVEGLIGAAAVAGEPGG